MKIAIVGAAGRTGRHLVGEALARGWRVSAVCREPSLARLDGFRGRDGFEAFAAPVVSDEGVLTRALAGCDGVVTVLIAVRRLKATALVASLARAGVAGGVTRFAFTAGEVTAVPEAGEARTRRQRLMFALVPPLMRPTPYSVADMLDASIRIREQPEWDWTIVRAPTLTDGPKAGYRLCALADVTGSHALSRADYADCLLDSLTLPERHRRTLTVVSGDAG